MTHAVLRADFPNHALEPCMCDGEATPQGDPIADPAADGHPVQLYRCEKCGHWIPLDVTAGRVRNDYPDFRGLVRELAASMLAR